ncbi:terminase small subunit [Lysinibacillus xylanilyticus]|uniref:terminase small subunit n=1 Tax=Lysinibacillus xylanilyticus TaxID=582475 RepID=UPI002B256018|nr:terminase small subunit [Lysinibacillus xylanilyticus]
MANWDKIKREYETTKITLAKLAEKHDVPLGTVKSQKSRDTKNGNTWTRDAAKKDVTKTKKVATIKEDALEEEVVYFSDDDGNGLNDKQQLFVAYYVKCRNATKAYQKAYGCTYSTAMVEGSRHLRKPKIREEITRVRDSLTEDALLDKRSFRSGLI